MSGVGRVGGGGVGSLRGMPEARARRTRSTRWEPLTVGIDIGGAKVLGAVVDAAGSIVDMERRPTEGHDVRRVEDTIVDLVTEFARRYDVAAVGIGAAGFVDVTRTIVMFSPHLDWRREPLRAKVAERVRLPVVVDNDANTMALAESRFGAGRGHRFVLCVTMGTGIGGALVLDQRVYRGANGMAGEFGHMQVVPDGLRCECGLHGCWEQYCSGRALERVMRVAVGRHLDGREVSRLARRGDEGLRADREAQPAATGGQRRRHEGRRRDAVLQVDRDPGRVGDERVGRAGVVVREDLPGRVALGRHLAGAVLAHPHPVAPPGAGEAPEADVEEARPDGLGASDRPVVPLQPASRIRQDSAARVARGAESTRTL